MATAMKGSKKAKGGRRPTAADKKIAKALGLDPTAAERLTHPFCYYVPPDHSTFVKGAGYRVVIVEETVPGYYLTGDDDFATNVRAVQPYFYGDRDGKGQAIRSEESLRQAILTCEDVNARRGVDRAAMTRIINSSMAAQNAQQGAQK